MSSMAQASIYSVSVCVCVCVCVCMWGGGGGGGELHHCPEAFCCCLVSSRV